VHTSLEVKQYLVKVNPWPGYGYGMDLDVPYPISSYPPGQGMGYAKGYVPGYGVNHTLHYSFVLVFCECTFHHTLGPGYGEHTLWRRVHVPSYLGTYPGMEHPSLEVPQSINQSNPQSATRAQEKPHPSATTRAANPATRGLLKT